MSEIRLDRVTKHFEPEHAAVDDLSVTFGEKEFVCLLGPSGCGKTTTLRMIAGLERADRGEIRHGDRVLSSSRTGEYIPPERRGMGLMFQSYALWPHMTVAENIAFGLQMQRWSRGDQRERITELISLLRIDGLEERYPSELSGGQQQRVALARMLAVSPDVLLLDEPLSNLDAALRLEMRAELKRLHERIGCTVIFVTHDQLEAMTLATSIVVMHEGRLQQYAAPMKVYREPRNVFVAGFVGHPPMNLLRLDGEHAVAAAALCDAWAAATGERAGQVAAVGVRPENLTLLDRAVGGHGSSTGTEAPGEFVHFRAVVESLHPTGPETIVHLRAMDAPLFAFTWGPPRFTVGDEVDATVAPGDVQLFGPDEERITHREGDQSSAGLALQDPSGDSP